MARENHVWRVATARLSKLYLHRVGVFSVVGTRCFGAGTKGRFDLEQVSHSISQDFFHMTI